MIFEYTPQLCHQVSDYRNDWPNGQQGFLWYIPEYVIPEIEYCGPAFCIINSPWREGEELYTHDQLHPVELKQVMENDFVVIGHCLYSVYLFIRFGYGDNFKDYSLKTYGLESPYSSINVITWISDSFSLRRPQLVEILEFLRVKDIDSLFGFFKDLFVQHREELSTPVRCDSDALLGRDVAFFYTKQELYAINNPRITHLLDAGEYDRVHSLGDNDEYVRLNIRGTRLSFCKLGLLSSSEDQFVHASILNSILAYCKERMEAHGLSKLSFDAYKGPVSISRLKDVTNLSVNLSDYYESYLKAYSDFLIISYWNYHPDYVCLPAKEKESFILYRVLENEVAHLADSDNLYSLLSPEQVSVLKAYANGFITFLRNKIDESCTDSPRIDFCTYIVPGVEKSRDEIETDITRVSKKSAQVFSNLLMNYRSRGYLDFRNEPVSEIFEYLKTRYKLPYSFDTFRKAFHL